MSDEREGPGAANAPDEQVEDLAAKPLEGDAAEQVKGGTFDSYMKIDVVEAQSTSKTGQIELQSFDWGK